MGSLQKDSYKLLAKLARQIIIQKSECLKSIKYATVHAIAKLLTPENYLKVEVMRLNLRGRGLRKRQKMIQRRVVLKGDPKRREILDLGCPTVMRSGQL